MGTRKLATDHFHHYTYGDTNEPDVSEQIDPLTALLGEHETRLNELFERLRAVEPTPVAAPVEPTPFVKPPGIKLAELMIELWNVAAGPDVSALEANTLEAARKTIERIKARRGWR